MVTGGRPQRNALVGQLIELLTANIADGSWGVGDRIPTENELAAEYGVSRVTLRQAVQALVHVGLLETIQGNGTFVRARTEIEAVVGRYLASEGVVPVLELRQAIESHAAALAAARAERQHLDVMRAAIVEGERAVAAGDVEAASRASGDFHRAVVDASGNPTKVALYAALQRSVLESIRGSTPSGSEASFVDGHARILDAIERHDAGAAHDLAAEHLRVSLGGDGD